MRIEVQRGRQRIVAHSAETLADRLLGPPAVDFGEPPAYELTSQTGVEPSARGQQPLDGVGGGERS